eukprot:gene5330-9139_t
MSKQHQQQNEFCFDLIDDIWSDVVPFLDLKSLLQFSLTSKKFYGMSENNNFWPLEYIRIRDLQSSLQLSKTDQYRKAVLEYHEAFYSNTKILVDYSYQLPIGIHFSKLTFVLLGDPKVGKSTVSALSVTGLSSQFSDVHETYTYTFTCNKSEMMNVVNISEDINDIELFSNTNEINTILGFVFSVDDRDSFKNISKKWLQKFDSHKIIKILIGTKIDLRNSKSNHVQYSEALNFAKKHNFYAYCECSKKNRWQNEGVMRVATKAYFSAKYGKIDKEKKCLIQ